MTASEFDALVWKWLVYFMPEARAAVLFAALGLAALWLLVGLRVVDRVR